MKALRSSDSCVWYAKAIVLRRYPEITPDLEVGVLWLCCLYIFSSSRCGEVHPNFSHYHASHHTVRNFPDPLFLNPINTATRIEEPRNCGWVGTWDLASFRHTGFSLGLRIEILKGERKRKRKWGRVGSQKPESTSCRPARIYGMIPADLRYDPRKLALLHVDLDDLDLVVVVVRQRVSAEFVLETEAETKPEPGGEVDATSVREKKQD